VGWGGRERGLEVGGGDVGEMLGGVSGDRSGVRYSGRRFFFFLFGLKLDDFYVLPFLRS